MELAACARRGVRDRSPRGAHPSCADLTSVLPARLGAVPSVDHQVVGPGLVVARRLSRRGRARRSQRPDGGPIWTTLRRCRTAPGGAWRLSARVQDLARIWHVAPCFLGNRALARPFGSGRYWVRTSDLFGVNEARYHCANRPQTLCASTTLSHRWRPGSAEIQSAF
jgi:hypothetical protein